MLKLALYFNSLTKEYFEERRRNSTRYNLDTRHLHGLVGVKAPLSLATTLAMSQNGSAQDGGRKYVLIMPAIEPRYFSKCCHWVSYFNSVKFNYLVTCPFSTSCLPIRKKAKALEDDRNNGAAKTRKKKNRKENEYIEINLFTCQS